MGTSTASINGILLQAALSFLLSIQHNGNTFTINFWKRGISYFIALTQTHCTATKKTDAWDKTKAASIAAFLQSLILLGAHFHRAAFRDTSKRRSPPLEVHMLFLHSIGWPGTETWVYICETCQESWHEGRGDGAGGRRK